MAEPAAQTVGQAAPALAQPGTVVASADSSKISFSGRAGGPFNVNGVGFGAVAGHLTIAGREVPTTSWRDHLIKGQLPLDVMGGEIVVHLQGGGVKTGKF